MLAAESAAAGVFAARRLGFHLSQQLHAFATALLPAAATTVAVLGAEVSGVLPGMPPAALLVTKAAVGAAVGLPLVFLLARPAWREVAG